MVGNERRSQEKGSNKPYNNIKSCSPPPPRSRNKSSPSSDDGDLLGLLGGLSERVLLRLGGAVEEPDESLLLLRLPEEAEVTRLHLREEEKLIEWSSGITHLEALDEIQHRTGVGSTDHNLKSDSSLGRNITAWSRITQSDIASSSGPHSSRHGIFETTRHSFSYQSAMILKLYSRPS